MKALYDESMANAGRYRDALADLETYCLFIGYQRSGSSLIGSLLDAHPEVVGHGERIVGVFAKMGTLGASNPAWVDDALDAPVSDPLCFGALCEVLGDEARRLLLMPG